VGGALDECSADRIGGRRALVDDFTINMMALPVAHLGQVNAAGRRYVYWSNNEQTRILARDGSVGTKQSRSVTDSFLNKAHE
jgi:hypothetical protein